MTIERASARISIRSARRFAATAALALAGIGTNARAADLSWSGYYRVEGLRIHGSELNSLGSDKAYMLHHLVLQPKIVAADGVTVYGRFDVFNNSVFGADAQLGEFFGSGPRAGYGAGTPDNNATTNATNSNVLSRTQRAGSIAVTSLHAVWSHEFGQLIVGRVPVQFGLGVVHNAGRGVFDHWMSTKDVVAYKAVFGNIFVMPMLGKVSEGDLGHEDDVNDYVVQIQYDNPDTDLSLGLFYELRAATVSGNDVPVAGPSAVSDSQTGGFKSQLWSVFVKRKLSDFTIGVEGDFMNGETGTRYAGSGVSLNAFAVAGEIAWRPADSRFSSLLKVGFASGDDPGTRDSYEGFVFSRNYDVGFILFNHPLGQYDVLRTGLYRDTSVKASSQPDTESVSNAIYAAPSLDFKWRDNLSLNGTFVYAMLNKDPVASGSTSKDLGYELDLGVTYKPYERLTWKTQAGFFLPGAAWRGSGSVDYENRVAYGLETKAAISF